MGNMTQPLELIDYFHYLKYYETSRANNMTKSLINYLEYNTTTKGIIPNEEKCVILQTRCSSIEFSNHNKPTEIRYCKKRLFNIVII